MCTCSTGGVVPSGRMTPGSTRVTKPSPGGFSTVTGPTRIRFCPGAASSGPYLYSRRSAPPGTGVELTSVVVGAAAAGVARTSSSPAVAVAANVEKRINSPCDTSLTVGNITTGNVSVNQFRETTQAPARPPRRARARDGRGGPRGIRRARLRRRVDGRHRGGVRHHEADAVRLLRLEGWPLRRLLAAGSGRASGRRPGRGAGT